MNRSFELVKIERNGDWNQFGIEFKIYQNYIMCQIKSGRITDVVTYFKVKPITIRVKRGAKMEYDALTTELLRKIGVDDDNIRSLKITFDNEACVKVDIRDKRCNLRHVYGHDYIGLNQVLELINFIVDKTEWSTCEIIE